MKKQNIFNSLIFGILFFVSLVSCREEDHAGQLADNIVLRIQTQQSLGRATEPDAEVENKIDCLDAWFYQQDADDSEQPLLHLAVEGNTEIKIDALTLDANGMSATGTYDVYVVANLPTSATVSATSTLGELKGCEYIATLRPGMNGASFCMSKWKQLDFSSGRIQSILLQRQAVKLNVNLVNETSYADFTINKVLIRNDQQKVALFEPAADSATPASETFVSDLIVSNVVSTDNPAVYTAYIYENLSDIPTVIEVQATIDGETRKYLADIKPDDASKLLRNSACQVTLRLKDILAVNVTCTIVPWNEKGMNEPMEPIYLDIANSKVGVDFINGGYVMVKTNASNIQVDWSAATGYYLQGYMDESSANINVTNGVAQLIFRRDQTTVTSKDINITAQNITIPVQLESLPSPAFFDIVSSSINGFGTLEDIEGTTLPWDLGDEANSTKININVHCNVDWFYSIRHYYIESDGSQSELDLTRISLIYAGNNYDSQPIIMYQNYVNKTLYAELDLGILNETGNVVVQKFRWEVAPYPAP